MSLWQVSRGQRPLAKKKAFAPKNGTKACKSIRGTTRNCRAKRPLHAHGHLYKRLPPYKRDMRPRAIGRDPSRPTRAQGRFSLPLRGDPHRTPALRTCTILRLALRLLFGAFPFTEFISFCSLLYQPFPHPQTPSPNFYEILPFRAPSAAPALENPSYAQSRFRTKLFFALNARMRQFFTNQSLLYSQN